ncbi:type VI secretion system baseplate subunit TssF [Pseudomonas aeruginosa]|uniref:type VI secretion system baseplate subunit TssF n=1 Tax=Pseudomonas aeruginosa TaxID=287 RepID=UPI002236582E|nr:type VI secretion system baseplate subunit TssF [Pseudomonas aeruginosa]
MHPGDQPVPAPLRPHPPVRATAASRPTSACAANRACCPASSGARARARPTSAARPSSPWSTPTRRAGPSRPRASRAHDASAWRLISQLSLNYLSLAERGQGAAALRELLRL